MFTDAATLADGLDRLFRTWPVPTPTLEQLRAGAAGTAAGPRWQAHWQHTAAPELREACTR